MASSKNRIRKRVEYLAHAGDMLGISSTYEVRGGTRVRETGHSIFTNGQDFYSRNEVCLDATHVPLSSKSIEPKGGPLDLRCAKIVGGFTGPVEVNSSSMVYGYKGRFRCGHLPGVTSLVPPGSTHDAVAAYAAKAWNRFRPGRPEADMGVFLGELRELPGQLKETCSRLKDIYRSIKHLSNKELLAGKGSKQIGKDYLLYQFGWVPFLSDIRKCYALTQNIDRVLSNIRQNNGVLRRRGGVLLSTGNSEVLVDGPDWGALSPVLPSPMYSGTPRYTKSRSINSRIWFKGAFRYWIPDMGTPQWKSRTKRLLYGLTVNAEVVWELIPWSWLIDYFANVGDMLSSLDDGWADNLTSTYAFTMGLDETIEYHSAHADFSGGGSVNVSASVHYTSKQRVGASPYGPGVSFDSLSPKRIAILSALGLSRLKQPKFFK